MPITSKEIQEALWKEDFRGLFPELKTEINKYFAAPKCTKCWTRLLKDLLLEKEKIEKYFNDILDPSIKETEDRPIPLSAKIRGTRGILDIEDHLLVGIPELSQALWSKEFRSIFKDKFDVVQAYYSTKDASKKNEILRDLYPLAIQRKEEVEKFYKVPICFYDETKEFFDKYGNSVSPSLERDTNIETKSEDKAHSRPPNSICGCAEKKVLMSLWVDEFRSLFPEVQKEITIYLEDPHNLANKQDLIKYLSTQDEAINKYFSRNGDVPKTERKTESPEQTNSLTKTESDFYGEQEIKDSLWMRSFRDLFPDARDLIKKYFLKPKDEENFRQVLLELNKYPERLREYFQKNSKGYVSNPSQPSKSTKQVGTSPTILQSVAQRLPKDRHSMKVDINRLSIILKDYPPPKFIIETLTPLNGIDRGKSFLTILEF